MAGIQGGVGLLLGSIHRIMKHQHFIPRSFLRNFAEGDEGKHFVDIYSKTSGKLKSPISIADVCVNKNIYTIPEPKEGDKYYLEKFYAKHVDSVYPEVYELLTNDKITTVTGEQRLKIINCCLSLYFRTPKFLNAYNDLTDEVIDNLASHADKESGIIKAKVLDESLEFHISEIEDVKRQLRVKNKKIFISTHLQAWQEYVKHKLNSGIAVYQLEDDIDLITSDNPVNIHPIHGGNFTLFDPDNIISLALDRRHFLTIMPTSVGEDYHEIHRGYRNKWFALTTNSETAENAENWLIGYPGTINRHLQDQIHHNQITSENLQAVEDHKLMLSEMNELMEIINQVGGIYHQRVANKVREMRKLSIFENDRNFDNIIEELAKHGFLTV